MAFSSWQLVERIARLRSENFSAWVDPAHPAAGLQIESLSGCALAGVGLLGVQIEPSASTIALATAPTTPIDCFVRGNDFVATYSEAAERPFRTQIYWRLIDGEPAIERSGNGHRATAVVMFELIVSVQTSRLNTDSAVAVCTTLSAVEAWRLLDIGEDRPVEAGHSPLGTIPFGTMSASNVQNAVAVAPEFEASDRPGCCVIRPVGSEFSYIELVHPADFRQTSVESTNDSSPCLRLTHRLFAEPLEKGVILRSRIRGLFVPRSHDTELARTEYRRFATSDPPLTT